MRTRRRRLITVAAALCLFLATSAQSCSSSLSSESNALSTAQQQLNQAQQSLNALTATCAQLQDPSAANQFAQQEAQTANLPNQSQQATEAAALADLTKRCSGSVNSSYQPFDDVQTDLTTGSTP
jgi:hypothetical protein